MACDWYAVPVIVIALSLSTPLLLELAGEQSSHSFGAVERVEWHNLLNVRELSKPTILANTPVSAWGALAWKPQYLARHARPTKLRATCQADSPVFTFSDETKPLSVVKDLPRPPRSRDIRVSVREFWELARSPATSGTQSTACKHYYMSTALSNVADESLRRDAHPTQWIHDASGSTAEGAEVMLWMGTAGVTANTHYDESHNIYLQLSGTKRFVLTEPRAHWAMRLHPWLHPSQRQAQAGGGDGEVEGGELEQLEAVLGPGDALYIPPYWFHRVTAVTTSVSLSTWTEPEQDLDAVDAMAALPLPFELEWEQGKLVCALQCFMRAVEKCAFGTVDAFVPRVVLTRYVSLFGRVDEAESAYCQACSSCGSEVLEEEERNINAKAQMVCTAASVISSQAAMELHVANYLEVVTSFLMGPESVNEVLQCCVVAPRAHNSNVR